jgi:hypothetical protein
MTMKIKNLILCLAFVAGVGLHQAKGQLNVSYQFSDLGQKIGVGYSLKKVVDFDALLYGAEYFENLSPEFTVRVNIIRKESYKVYLGTGFRANRASSWLFPVGVQATPFKSFPRFGVRFDLNLMVGMEERDPERIIPGLGISYAFW